MNYVFDKHGRSFDISISCIDEHQRYLAYMRKKKEKLFCHCQKVFEKRKLAICKIQGNYYIKRYPNDGMFHDQMCRFYSCTEGNCDEAEKAFRVVDSDGRIEVRLNISFFYNPKIKIGSASSHNSDDYR